ncbi:hypothetical protein SDC9_108132 [bioreactor metagenome]|uniref:Uncharacterized protein n=1 Tax=bioreactor metagenome TaxID=1076179 RepID=A0A645BHQ1_9ZZZZ
MIILIGTTGVSGFIPLNPSIAETIVIEGVIIPSAINVLAPMIAIIYNHFFLFLRISAYNARMPPSPLLSALRVIKIYLTVVCNVKVHIMHEIAPMI